jgi:hypothetical protein
LFFRFLTVEEAILVLEELSEGELDDDEKVDVSMEPPNEGDLSVEDSATEDDGGIISNISRVNLLFSQCLIVRRNRRKTEEDSSDSKPNNLNSTLIDTDKNLPDPSALHDQAYSYRS